MDQQRAQELLDSTIAQIFGYKNPFTLEQFMAKFAFDIRLPQAVHDSTDNTLTWAQSTNPTKFIRMDKARGIELAGASQETDFLRPARPLEAMDQLLQAWNEINYTTTERLKDCVNVAESDSISFSENVYRSQDIRKSKNIIFSDGLSDCEFVAASQRSGNSTFCVRLEDSGECNNCFGVSWSGKLSNCLFMHDCGDMQDSMFCTNISGKRFCIANMQYSEQDYRRIREMVVRWLFTES